MANVVVFLLLGTAVASLMLGVVDAKKQHHQSSSHQSSSSSSSSSIPQPPIYSQPISPHVSYTAYGGSVSGGGPPPHYQDQIQMQHQQQPQYYAQPSELHPHHQNYARYEPILPAASSSHPYPIKRGGHSEIGNLALLIPLIILPLLICWPWFIYAASHHHHPVVYAAPGWKRSFGKEEAGSGAGLVEQLTEKVVAKLEKD